MQHLCKSVRAFSTETDRRSSGARQLPCVVLQVQGRLRQERTNGLDNGIMNKSLSPRLPKAAEVVARALRNRIVAEQLAEGTRLPTEAELMEVFGVGRVTAREALRLLEHDGLVEIRRGVGGGTFVRHPDISQISESMSLLFGVRQTTLREFLEFRLLVEPSAAELSAERIADDRRPALVEVASVGNRLERVPDLHMLIAEESGNRVLGLTLNALHHAFGAHFRRSQIYEQDLLATQAAHKKIARKILDGDAEGARMAMRVHLDAYAEYLKKEDLLDKPLVPRMYQPDNLEELWQFST